MKTIDSPNEIPGDYVPRFSEKDYAILLNLVVSRVPSASERARRVADSVRSEEEDEELLQLVNSLDKQLLANLRVSTGEGEKTEYAIFLFWQNLTHYLFRQGWSLGDLSRILSFLKR